MTVAPVINTNFKAVFSKSGYYTKKQDDIYNNIMNTLNSVNPNDKHERSYSVYLDDKGYDILTTPNQNDGINVYVMKKPSSEREKTLREYGVFYLTEENVAGIYNDDKQFNVDDVLKLYNLGQKEIKKNFALLLSIPFIAGAVLLGSAKGLAKLTQQGAKDTTKTVTTVIQDTMKLSKDTIEVLK